MKKFIANTAIKPHAFRHHFNVSAGLFAQGSDFIDEGNLGRQESIGRIFDHLSAFQIGCHDRELTKVERAINFVHHLCRPFILHTHDNTIRTHEIVNRSVFTQKLGVGCDVELCLRVRFRNNLFDLTVCTDWHGRLVTTTT